MGFLPIELNHVPVTSHIAVNPAASAVRPSKLRVEHSENPLGIDVLPRFSWQIASYSPNWTQRSFQIQVAPTLADLKREQNLLWDSGVVANEKSLFVNYGGPKPASRTQAWWRVRVTDNSGETSDWSEPGSFEMGLLDPADWTAKWIEFPIPRVTDLERSLTPVAYLRRTFHVGKAVKHARLYATALGVYRSFVNGKRISSDELSPGWTDYTKRLQYQTQDVTSQIKQGENVLAASLGDGWYAGYIGWGAHRDLYGKAPSLLMQLEVTYQDGTREVIGSDDQWVGRTGPILYDDILTGEAYDARVDISDWHSLKTSSPDWKPAKLATVPTAKLEAQPDAPVRVTQEITPKSIKPLPGDKWLVDLGQNMVGHVRLTVEAPAGQKIQMRFGEILNPDGTLYTTNLRLAKQTDTYIASGKGRESWEPTFTFHGFRYVEVTGFPGKPKLSNFTGRVVGSPLEQTGHLTTGHPMVNQLISNIDWGLRGNFVSVPTDCPQRDERLGWMGDAQIFVQTASINREAAAFYTKWLRDVVDAQSPAGGFSDVSPRKVDDADGAPAWGDAGVIVPWTVYRTYGDVRLLEDMYQPMVKWVEYIHSVNPNGLWLERRNNDFGDWLSIDAETPKEVLATAYYAHDCALLAKTAEVLGKKEDAAKYAALAQSVKDAFCKAFVTPDGKVHGETQTCYLLALHFDLVPDALRPLLGEHLVKNIEAKNNHLSTGFIGVGYLCPTLSEIGRDDVAFKLLLNDTFPSWGYSIARGATTIWERWDGWTNEKGFQDPGMNSFNHYSLGSVGEWMYRYMAGIDLTESDPGFRQIVMRPRPSKSVGHATASFASPYGVIESAWKYEGNDWVWTIKVPANTRASIEVPCPSAEAVTESGSMVTGEFKNGKLSLSRGSGEYQFRVRG